MQRRTLLRAAPLLAFTATSLTALAAAPQVEIWKDPNCGCCQDWAKHLNQNGFATRINDDGNNAAARTRLRIPTALGSCHTGLVAGYALEGHVPAREIHRLLKEKPQAIGLAVPGMPVGSPGMDGPAYGGQRDAYDVLLVLADGSTRVYQRYAHG